MRTKPGLSPRGEPSTPSGPTVLSTAKGDASMNWRYSGVIQPTSLTSEVSPGWPYRASNSSTVATMDMAGSLAFQRRM
ncbi:MAG: hypothetical protein WD270_11395 [Acetobacterales bacterium]